MLLDALIVTGSMVLSLQLRFDMQAPAAYAVQMWRVMPILVAVTLAALLLSGVYRTILKYASVDTFLRIVLSALAGTVLTFVIALVVKMALDTQQDSNILLMSRSIYFMQWLSTSFAMLGVRILRRLQDSGLNRRGKENRRRILVVGAGYGGATVIRDIQNGRYGEAVAVAVVDDDKDKIGSEINRVPVVGGTQELAEHVQRTGAEEIIIAIATPKGNLTALIEQALATGCKVRMFTATQDMKGAAAREVNIADLLGRPETHLDMTEAHNFFTGKRVLVTGGGGSIGAELCRQILAFTPEKLVLYDISENYMYDLYFELKEKYGEIVRNTVVLEVGSVRDPDSLYHVMALYKPQIVIHAAAHKHVPLMEGSPEQAILNNVFGTYNTACAARDAGAERFVMISTDKAVNPTNVMGASKRMAELIVGAMPHGKTAFMTVRFGNVLGSHGSVVPIFERQIKAGGPVTLTHPDIIRYFMTIPEAASLVLQAASMAKGGELYVLDMGEPVKIRDLAEQMIQLYGTGKEKIIYTGLRPGEKLFEELLRSEENSTATSREKIFIAKPETHSWEEVEPMLEELRRCIETRGDVKACLHRLLPAYREPEEVNGTHA